MIPPGLADAIRSVAHAVEGVTRYGIDGILVGRHDGGGIVGGGAGLCAVATDGHRLAWAVAPLEGGALPTWRYLVCPEKLGAAFASEWCGSTPAGEFPDWTAAIPTKRLVEVYPLVDSLTKGVKAAAKASRLARMAALEDPRARLAELPTLDEVKAYERDALRKKRDDLRKDIEALRTGADVVRLVLANGGTYLYVHVPERILGGVDLPFGPSAGVQCATVEGAVDVRLNTAYLLDALRHVGPGASITFAGELSPVVLRSADGLRGAIVMPVRP